MTPLWYFPGGRKDDGCKREERRLVTPRVLKNTKAGPCPPHSRTMDVLAHYRDTTYWVETPARYFPLRVDQLHPEFDAFLAPFGTEWAFITACNPRSRPLTPAENRQRTAELEHALHGQTFWPGLGVGTGDWFPEASYCIVMPLAEALNLAKRFDQNAILAGHVGGHVGGPAELHWV